MTNEYLEIKTMMVGRVIHPAETTILELNFYDTWDENYITLEWDVTNNTIYFKPVGDPV